MISENKVVSIHYTLTNVDGEVLDSSEGQAPLSYLTGAGNIIIGLETALVGKAVGDKVDVVVPAEQAYGEVNPEMIQQVPRAAFQGVDDIEVGMQFNANSEQGELLVVVRAVEEEFVIVDANHPLAGQDLSFAVSVEDVRDATEEEIANGRVA